MKQKLGFILANCRMKLEIELRSFDKKEKEVMIITSKKCEKLWNSLMIIFLVFLIGLFIPIKNNIKIIYEIILFISFIVLIYLYLKEKKIYKEKSMRQIYLQNRLEEIKTVINDLEKNNKEILDLPLEQKEAKQFLKQLYEVESIKEFVLNKITK